MLKTRFTALVVRRFDCLAIKRVQPAAEILHEMAAGGAHRAQAAITGFQSS